MSCNEWFAHGYVISIADSRLMADGKPNACWLDTVLQTHEMSIILMDLLKSDK